MRRILIAGNWKMNHTVSEAGEFFKALQVTPGAAELIICPPFTDIPLTRFFLEKSGHKWGAQNVYPEEKGAYTGEISPSMLADLGCSYVICGHSERRQILGESDAFVTQKVRAVLNSGMQPILCVGETLEEREGGKTEARIREELEAVFHDMPKDKVAMVVVAYEPIWAIGSGQAADAGDAETVAAYIRQTIRELTDKHAAEQARILYGGSVQSGNIVEFLKEKNIDGALIGGASLKSKDLSELYSKANSISS
ncbi:MAG: triose-phosphate isomerase [Dialister sp.]|nr:triose-phosphate isomerase [Dialister sp.]